MSDTLYVTPAQVLAAQLAVELAEEDGEEPDEALRAIANAQVQTDEELPASYPTDVEQPASTADADLVRGLEPKTRPVKLIYVTEPEEERVEVWQARRRDVGDLERAGLRERFEREIAEAKELSHNKVSIVLMFVEPSDLVVPRPRERDIPLESETESDATQRMWAIDLSEGRET